MNTERQERIEMGREHRTFEDRDGSKGYEDVVNYNDGHVATGEFTEGLSAGHKWFRGEGGTVDTAPEIVSVAGLKDVVVLDFRPGKWGTILEQGENAKKPPTGESWFEGHTSTEEVLERLHDDAELVLREGTEKEQDEKERTVYEVRRGSNGKLMVIRTTYFDLDGYKISTGKHVEGPEEGKVWEERRALDAEHEQAIPSVMETEHGSMRNLAIRGFNRTIAPGKKEIEEGRTIDERALHLVMRGEWESKAAQE